MCVCKNEKLTLSPPPQKYFVKSTFELVKTLSRNFCIFHLKEFFSVEITENYGNPSVRRSTGGPWVQQPYLHPHLVQDVLPEIHSAQGTRTPPSSSTSARRSPGCTLGTRTPPPSSNSPSPPGDSTREVQLPHIYLQQMTPSMRIPLSHRGRLQRVFLLLEYAVNEEDTSNPINGLCQ